MDNLLKKNELNPLKLPSHIGIVMDGNGRWATKRFLPRLAGHRKGVERVMEISEICSKIGIEALTLFAFSDENWRRPDEEVGGIMSLFRWYLKKERQRIIDNNLQFRVIGDRKKLSIDIAQMVEDLERDSSQNTGMNLIIALSYGARGEILRATRKIVEKVQNQQIYINDIDEKIFEMCLDTSGLPPLDMFIRTSGEYRVSNFLLWQLAYSEMFFEDVLWPDFDSQKMISLLKCYEKRERRFGKTSEQIQKK